MMARLIVVFLAGVFSITTSAADAKPVKMSQADICYCVGASKYESLINVKGTFATLDQCLAQPNAREPKFSRNISNQGDCRRGSSAQQVQSAPTLPAAPKSNVTTRNVSNGSYVERESARIAQCLSGVSLPLWTYEECGIGVKPLKRREW